MEIIPAIDVIDGKCVRLTKGDYQTQRIYHTDPLKTALAFQNAGIRALHVVDLEGAKRGKVKNWKTIERLAKSTNLILQVGGGFRTEREIQRLFSLGVHQVILGTLAFEAPEILKKLLKKFGKEKIVIDVATKRQQLYSRGWQKKVNQNLDSFFQKLLSLGVKTVIYSDITRDGTMQGPNFSLYKTLVKRFPNFHFIASSGIRNAQDLRKLAHTGVRGAIIGKAIYEGKISPRDIKPFL